MTNRFNMHADTTTEDTEEDEAECDCGKRCHAGETVCPKCGNTDDCDD